MQHKNVCNQVLTPDWNLPLFSLFIVIQSLTYIKLGLCLRLIVHKKAQCDLSDLNTLRDNLYIFICFIVKIHLIGPLHYTTHGILIYNHTRHGNIKENKTTHFVFLYPYLLDTSLNIVDHSCCFNIKVLTSLLLIFSGLYVVLKQIHHTTN